MPTSGDAYEVHRSGKWIAVAPEEIGAGERYRQTNNGLRVYRGGKGLFVGPVDTASHASGVLDQPDQTDGASQPGANVGDVEIDECFGVLCQYARSGFVEGYGRIKFLKCALKNKPIMDLEICPNLKWRRNWKGEITINEHKA
jgi:hypothetical protein